MKERKLLSKTTILVAILLVSTMPLWANHVVVENITLTEQVVASHYTHIEFDISWDNSWKVSTGPSNWDAAWVFAKYNIVGDDPDLGWKHCTLNTSGHTAPTGSTIDATAVGVFIYLSAVGSGSNNWDDARLRWNYGTDGVADDATVDVKVFAIEMVNIPQGNFYLGDKTSTGTFRITGSNTPVQITTTAVVVKCEDSSYDDDQLEGDGILVDGDGGIDKDGIVAVDNTNYPTGYEAFYCMKYEISQGQWVDFCNTITSAQATNRWYINADYRHGTLSGSHPDYSTTRADRACNYLSVMDGMAYADWACLRPMTELEFEKACRGTGGEPTDYEYAWGNQTITAAAAISGAENGTETITTANANCCYNSQTFTGGDGGTGPLRCGIFATGSTTRQQSGASYYGIMEMSGNLWERPVTLGNSTGRGFEGTNGNGVLETAVGYEGNATNSDWPGYAAGQGVSGATGAGFRGGGWLHAESYVRVSDRNTAAHTYTYRSSNCGFRCVRSAP